MGWRTCAPGVKGMKDLCLGCCSSGSEPQGRETGGMRLFLPHCPWYPELGTKTSEVEGS